MNFPLLFIVIALTLFARSITAQPHPAYWQQQAVYEMHIRMDVSTHRFEGVQHVVYTNNSPDTLHQFYYHLHFNAFQPNSSMDVRSRSLPDPDSRVRDRILHLNEDEIGYHTVTSLKQNGQAVTHRTQGTLLIVDLAEPLLPGSETRFEMTFNSQVPVQIRRSGRNNREGIAYSMAQWYPRLAEYDAMGWHTHPYVAREFHGVFSDYNVFITIDSTYVLGGTGTVMNASEVGYSYPVTDPLTRRIPSPGKQSDTATPGYETQPVPALSSYFPVAPNEKTWHFRAQDVIDFVWAADPDYTHTWVQMPNGPRIHLLYVKSEQTRYWEDLAAYTAASVQFLNAYLGTYPYEQFSVIQGGDGGMEYPMATLITGHRSLRSLVSVTVHELLHMWFQTVLATNENYYHWMDEGFTAYMQQKVMQHLFKTEGNPHLGSYLNYLRITEQGLEEPMGQHADHFSTNRAYGFAAYGKGAIFLHQLEYVIGEQALKRTLQRYYEAWKFKHPTPNDLMRIAEKESGMRLDWYFNYMIYGTHTIDYAIRSVTEEAGETRIQLERSGAFPMPVDVFISYADGHETTVHIPLDLMIHPKPAETAFSSYTVADPWFWTHPGYILSIPAREAAVERAEIDPTLRLADVNRLNNRHPFPRSIGWMQPPQSSWQEYGIGYRPAVWYGQQSGIQAGLSGSGTYILNQHELDMQLMLTSGSITAYEPARTDADYRIAYRTNVRGLGREAYINTSITRFYGIMEEQVQITKSLGRYGYLEPVNTEVSLKAFHQARTAHRNVGFLDAAWDRGNLFGLELTLNYGEPGENGLQLNMTGASFRSRASASFVTLAADRTRQWTASFETRFSLGAGAGSRTMPAQYQWGVSGPTTSDAWADATYWSVANIDPWLTTDLNLVAKDASGLYGYNLPGINSPDIPGNNYITGTVWNSWAPFERGSALEHVGFDLYAAAGKSWIGTPLGDSPLAEARGPVLAALGAGLRYELSASPKLRRWVGQSRLLRGMVLSVDMPFYLHGVAGQEPWGGRIAVGVSR